MFSVSRVMRLAILCCWLTGVLGKWTAPTDEQTGCTGWGCTPSGTFTISSDIPGADIRPVGVIWMKTLSPAPPNGFSPRLGCVSSQTPAVVCATRSGYVSMNQTTGAVLWRYDNMTSPSLPFIDIMGNVIGSDGKQLVKINSDGSLEPVIKIFDGYAPMYSLKLADNNLFLMTSYVYPVLITYGTDGIVDAAYTVQDQVNGVNGSFYAIAQPVISGKRTYIIMQFVPDPHTPPQAKIAAAGIRRLYAIDIWLRLANRISPVWYYNLESMHEGSPSGSGSSCQGHGAVEAHLNGSVLVSNDVVYVSLAARPKSADSCGEDLGTLWAIKDKGNTSELVFTKPAPVAHLSFFDDSYGDASRARRHHHHQRLRRQGEGKRSRFEKKPRTRFGKKTGVSLPTTRTPRDRSEVIWASTSQTITGYNMVDGSVAYSIDVCKEVLKAREDQCNLTSRVMVAHSDDDKNERLVFAVSLAPNALRLDDTSGQDDSTFTKEKHASSSSNSLTTPYMIALDVSEVGSAREMWRVAGKPGTQIVGQIANVVYVPSAITKKSPQKTSTLYFARHSKGTLQNKIGFHDEHRRHNTKNGLQNSADPAVSRFEINVEIGYDAEEENKKEEKNKGDNFEIVLVASAVSATEQLAFAIGHASGA